MRTPPALEGALRAHAPRLGAFGRHLLWFDEVGSTNDVAARLAAQGADEGTTVVAEAQTAGRGRRGRQWFSPCGAGLYVSVVLRPSDVRGSQQVAALLTLMSGVAIADAVRAVTGLPVELKWPNDLVVGHPRRKVAGILAEASTTDGRLDSVILGFGVNVRDAKYPLALARRATSLEVELGRSVDRTALLVESLAALASCYGELRHGGTGSILSRWRALAPGARGAAVEWQSSRGPLRGVTDGVDDEGALLVRVGPAIERIVSGEVTWLSP